MNLTPKQQEFLNRVYALIKEYDSHGVYGYGQGVRVAATKEQLVEAYVVTIYVNPDATQP